MKKIKKCKCFISQNHHITVRLRVKQIKISLYLSQLLLQIFSRDFLVMHINIIMYWRLQRCDTADPGPRPVRLRDEEFSAANLVVTGSGLVVITIKRCILYFSLFNRDGGFGFLCYCLFIHLNLNVLDIFN